MEKYKKQFQSDEQRVTEFRSMLLDGPLKMAIDFAFAYNTPDRFDKSHLSGKDLIVKQSSELDQMKGWNDCLKFILDLPVINLPKNPLEVLEAYDADYIERVSSEKGNPI